MDGLQTPPVSAPNQGQTETRAHRTRYLSPSSGGDLTTGEAQRLSRRRAHKVSRFAAPFLRRLARLRLGWVRLEQLGDPRRRV